MKFLKKLGTTLLILLVIAAIFGVVVALNWDLFAAMTQRMQQMEQKQKEQEQIAEVTKEMRELLALAWEHFENTNLIEFEISNIYPDTGETADFMYKKNAVDRAQELMEQRWYKDNKTHVWLTEDGWLLRIGYPYTFETYESHFRTFAEWDTYESFEYALTDISYEVTESGEWLEVQTPSTFSQLRPVIKMVDLYYGEEVEPIVIPETYENLAG